MEYQVYTLLNFHIFLFLCHLLFNCCVRALGGMELQLGLALPAYYSTLPAVKLVENKQKLQPWRMFESTDNQSSCFVKNKRGFAEAFDKIENPHDQPLLLWHGQPNEEDDHNGLGKKASCPINNKNGEEGNEVVGWPPVKSWRRKLMCQHQGGRVVADRTAEKESGGVGPTYVKVKMEGVGIARKINLKLYQSYQTLTNSLIAMFARCKKCDADCVHYILTYQDKEGDWLLAGDVPWKTFIESVQRLELVRNGG